MGLKDFDVSPSLRNAIELIWDEYEVDGYYTPYYGILRSNDPNSGFEPLSVIKATQYVDKNLNLFKKWREYYYKILVLNDSGSGDKFFPNFERVDESKPKRIRTKPDAVTMEVIRRNDLLLKNYLAPDSSQLGPGKESYVLKRMSRGARCDQCWDRDAGRRTTKNCEACNGTGFKRGYFDPIPTYIQFNPENKRLKITDQGQIESSQTTARMSNFPVLNPRDIVVEPYADRRYRVVQVAKTEKGRHLISQNLSLREINADQIEYNIPIINKEAKADTSNMDIQFENSEITMDQIEMESNDLRLNAPDYTVNTS